jgi:hypothetical protein
MKNFICVLFILSVFSCKKAENTENVHFDEIEVQDFDDIEDEPEVYDTEAAKIKIESVEATKVTTSSCDKFVDYYKLNTQSSTTFKIKGYGFNTLQGQSKVKFLFRDVKELRPVTVVSWSGTEINIRIDTLPKGTKNVPIWFRVEREDSTGMKATISRLLKCVGVFNAVHFGQPMWEVEQQRDILNLQAVGTLTNITAAWVPTNGDVLSRDNGTKAVLMSKATTGSGATLKTILTVWERNFNCTGAIQKKKYTFQNGTIVAKTGETAFTKYQH